MFITTLTACVEVTYNFGLIHPVLKSNTQNEGEVTPECENEKQAVSCYNHAVAFISRKLTQQLPML